MLGLLVGESLLQFLAPSVRGLAALLRLRQACLEVSLLLRRGLARARGLQSLVHAGRLRKRGGLFGRAARGVNQSERIVLCNGLKGVCGGNGVDLCLDWQMRELVVLAALAGLGLAGAALVRQ